MIAFIKKQKEKVIILCYSVDRLQREFDEQYLQLQRLIKLDKVEVFYIKNSFREHKDMDSGDKFRKDLDVLLASDYKNKISDNVKRSIKKKLDEGTILGDSPLGYLNKQRIDTKKEKVEVYIDIEREHLVKKIFEEYSEGIYSLNDIRLMIDNDGLASKKGNKISNNVINNILTNPFYYGFMKYEGILYKHIYPRLISKELFDECQRVREGRARSPSKKTQKAFIFKEILKCKHCKCSYSPELKKKKYVYMRPIKNKGECNFCYHINENKILEQIEKVLQGMYIPEHILKLVNAELKKSSVKEHKEQQKHISALQKQNTLAHNKATKIRNIYIDGGFSKEEYDEAMLDLNVERENITVKLDKLNNADKSFNENLSTIFELASKSYELFKSSEIDEKRRIVNMVFQNLEMDGKKLEFSARKPFDMFLNVNSYKEWLPGKDSNLRPRD